MLDLNTDTSIVNTQSVQSIGKYMYFILYLGTCWGSYVVLRLCENVNFKAGVSYHPSHSRICELLEESEEELLKNVKCPQMFMPADGDHANNFPNGLGIF